MRMAKYMWRDYKTNVDILSELKMNLVLKKNSKLQKYMDATCMVNGQTQTATLNH
jgi:hypothetical protein